MQYVRVLSARALARRLHFAETVLCLLQAAVTMCLVPFNYNGSSTNVLCSIGAKMWAVVFIK